MEAYPEGPISLVLKPSRRKWTLIFLGGLAFAALGVAIVLNPSSLFDIVMGILCVLLAGGASIIAIAQMFGKAELKLSPDGFSAVSLRRTDQYRWAEITDGFGVARISRNKLVMFSLNRARTKTSSFNEALTGFGYGLPDTYGMQAEALAALMTGCWLKATNRS